MAQQATQLDPVNPRAWIALSYAQQASFKLEDALTSAQRAAELEPRSSIALTRVAELMMSLGRTAAAESAAQRAVIVNAVDSRARTVLGFAHLARLKIQTATQDFGEAIRLNSTDPLPRLGLGLAMIRRGDLEGGRVEIEIAVVLDPTNSLLRSYMGMVYYQEDTTERDRLAATQFELARTYDEKDPTAWLYDAILKQTQNQSVIALDELQTSIELNDYRAVSRSRLLLEQDLATRGATLAQIYADMGFGELAILEGTQALASDPASSDAHRFLSDTYLSLPRHEVGRLSELLQSQLWQPLNRQPIHPQLEEPELFIPWVAGSTAVSLNQFNPVFVSDGVSAQADFGLGTNETLEADVAAAALKGPVALSAGAFHYETAGFRPNADQTQNLANAFIQVALQPDTSVQAEVRWRNQENGDLALRFDPTQFSQAFRANTQVETYRVGLRHDFSQNSQLLVSALYQTTEQTQHDLRPLPPMPFPANFGIDTNFSQDAYLVEVQDVLRYGPAKFIAGLGYYNANENTNADPVVTTFLPFPPFTITTPLQPIALQANIEQSNGYLYSQLSVLERLNLLLGLSVDNIDAPVAYRTQVNPKLGLTWNPGAGLTLRAAAFRVLARSLINAQTIEPTQVAGFNQFFDDSAGTDSWEYAIGIDEAFSRRLFAGIQFARRDLQIPYLLPGAERLTADASQLLNRAYIYWAPKTWLALRSEYLFDKRERAPQLVPQGYDYTSLTTQHALFGAVWLANESWSIYLTAIYTAQQGDFLNTLSGVPSQGSDHFWVADAEVRWRIPLRHGFVSAGVKNLFNSQFQYQDPDPGNPTFLPERFFYVRLNVTF